MIFVILLFAPELLLISLWKAVRTWGTTGRAALVLGALTLTACHPQPPTVNPSALNVALTTSSAGVTLRYFGYFGSNYIGGDTGGAESADHTNLVFVYATVPDWRAQVEDAAGRGQSTVLNVQDILFDTATMRLRPDAAARWAAFAPRVGPVLGSVVAFYHMDEPGTNAASHPVPGCAFPWEAGAVPCWRARLELMRADVETANALITATFPQTPIAVTFGSHELFSDELPGWDRLPAGFAWVGFDCYGDFHHCARIGHSVPATLARLQALMTPGQAIAWFPDGSRFRNWAAPDLINGSEAGLNDRVSQYFALALATPGTIAIMPYLWGGYADPTFGPTEGVRELPAVRALYTKIGTAITRGQIVPGFTWGWFAFGLPADVPFLVQDTKFGAPTPTMFRPAEGAWYLNGPDAAGSGYHTYEGDNVRRIQFGLPGDWPFAVKLAPWCLAPSCPTVFRPADGSWYIGTRGFVSACDNVVVRIQFGARGDVPKIVYWGQDPYVAIYRPSTRQTIASVTNRDYRAQDARIW